MLLKDWGNFRGRVPRDRIVVTEPGSRPSYPELSDHASLHTIAERPGLLHGRILGVIASWGSRENRASVQSSQPENELTLGIPLFRIVINEYSETMIWHSENHDSVQLS